MSASLERIVRPAQTAGIRPSNFAVARAAPGSDQSALLTWGGPGANDQCREAEQAQHGGPSRQAEEGTARTNANRARRQVRARQHPYPTPFERLREAPSERPGRFLRPVPTTGTAPAPPFAQASETQQTTAGAKSG